MKIAETLLTDIEQKHKILIIQSDFPEIAYAISDKGMYIINRKTGHELPIAADNIYSFADEIMSIADVYLPRKIFMKGA